jgi:cytoskeletal protein RodZ
MKTVEWIMLISFVGALGLSVWKLYLFFPKTKLADDDTTPESVEVLERIMVETDRNHPSLDEENLFQKMTEHPSFDPDHFWRFNQNRLRQLIEHYRFKYPDFRR